MSKILKLFFILIFIKSLIWLILTPIFQVPDEPSHFSIIQYLSHQGKRPNPRREKPTSQEILKVSEIVNFNWQITHPVWQGYQDNWREQINQIPQTDRSNYLRNPYQTSLKRPPLYYWLATIFYYPFKSTPFLLRFFSVRLFSVLISLVIVYFSFQITQKLFNQVWLSLSIASLVAFQPLLSFISVGAHYDSLAILISTIFLYLVISFLQTQKKSFLNLSLLAVFLGILTRPDLIIFLAIYPFILPKRQVKKLILPALIGLTILGFLPHLILRLVEQGHWSSPFISTFSLNEYAFSLERLVSVVFSREILTQLIGYSQIFKQSHLFQIFPWYWGVFGWLESTLPLWVYRVLKLIILISLFGWFKLFLSKKANLKLIKSTVKSLMVFFIFSLFHFSSVILNDFRVFTTSGDVFGIQGRYLLPAITPHMILLVFGLLQLIPKKHHQLFYRSVILFSILLNFIGLKTLYQYFGWVWH